MADKGLSCSTLKNLSVVIKISATPPPEFTTDPPSHYREGIPSRFSVVFESILTVNSEIVL